jgi:hypothetical protein
MVMVVVVAAAERAVPVPQEFVAALLVAAGHALPGSRKLRQKLLATLME